MLQDPLEDPLCQVIEGGLGYWAHRLGHHSCSGLTLAAGCRYWITCGSALSFPTGSEMPWLAGFYGMWELHGFVGEALFHTSLRNKRCSSGSRQRIHTRQCSAHGQHVVPMVHTSYRAALIVTSTPASPILTVIKTP